MGTRIEGQPVLGRLSAFVETTPPPSSGLKGVSLQIPEMQITESTSVERKAQQTDEAGNKVSADVKVDVYVEPASPGKTGYIKIEFDSASRTHLTSGSSLRLGFSICTGAACPD